jgi:nitroreductase
MTTPSNRPRFLQRIAYRAYLAKDFAAATIFRLIGRSRSLVRLYYAFIDGRFTREQWAVARGRARFARDVANPSGARAVMRRNVHRLEKGLTMMARKPLFATDYIVETARAFSIVHGDPAAEMEELKWAQSVLLQYFESVAEHPAVAEARRLFESVERRSPEQGLVPYRRDLSLPPTVGYDDFLALCRRRRSVRFFIDRPVPREVIDHAVIAAAQAPSACNRQPFQFRIFDDRDLIRSIAPLAPGAVGFAGDAPALVVLVGTLRMFFDERDRHLIYIDSSLASMTFMIALETLGLSSCPINWPDLEDNERRMAAILGLTPDERPIMLIAVGYADPDGLVAYSQKKGLDQLRRYN